MALVPLVLILFALNGKLYAHFSCVLLCVCCNLLHMVGNRLTPVDTKPADPT